MSKRKVPASPVRPAAPATRTAVKSVAQAVELPKTQFFAPNFWRNHWLPCLLMLVASVALYFQAIKFGYVLDDQMVIWDNSFVQKGFGGLREIFAYDSFMGYFKEQKFLLEGGRYRPLSLATFAMEVGIFGKDKPKISHFINILWYAATAIMLYRLLLGLFPRRESGSWSMSLAFVAAMYFVFHPLHIEVVANIKGRDEILALFFSLATWYATLKYFDTQKTGWLVAIFAYFLLGLFAKENTLTFLAVVPLSLWLFSEVTRGQIFKVSMLMLAAALVFIVIRFKAMGYMVNHGQSMDDLMNNPFLGMTGSEKAATIALTLGWYLKLLFVPYPLTHDYYPYHVPKVNWSDWKALISAVLYILMGVWAVWQVWRTRREGWNRQVSWRTIISFSIIYYLSTLSIVSNIFVGVGTFMNERFLFMPSLAFVLMMGWLLAWQVPTWLKEAQERHYLLGSGLLAMVLAAFSYITFQRVPDWENALTLNRSAVEVSPGSCRSHSFYATALYKDVYVPIRNDKTKAEEVKKLVEQMDYHVNRALEINPDYGAAMTMKAAIAAAVFEQDGQLDKLFHAFDIVLDKKPNTTSIRDFVAQYMKYLQRSANPNKFATFCYRRGYEFFWKEKKDVKSALEFLNYALDQQTEDKRVLESLAEIYQATGNPTKAEEMRRRAAASFN